MRTPDQYREFAAECYRLASEAKKEEHERILREMARAWSELKATVRVFAVLAQSQKHESANGDRRPSSIAVEQTALHSGRQEMPAKKRPTSAR
jgi:hypothetical protein